MNRAVNNAKPQRVTEDEASAAWPVAADPADHSPEANIDRRRFWRAWQSPGVRPGVPGESFESLEAELVLLREENARLKASQRQRPELDQLLGRARTLPAREARRDGGGDEATQMLVEGLVIREALVEICQEIERSMVVFEAKLEALREATAPAPSEPDQEDADALNVAVSELRLAPAAPEIEPNGDSPENA